MTTECCVCRRFYDTSTPVERMHHIRTLAGGTKVRDNAPEIPLCFDHHTGIYGIHTLGRETWEQLYGTEISYLKEERNG